MRHAPVVVSAARADGSASTVTTAYADARYSLRVHDSCPCESSASESSPNTTSARRRYSFAAEFLNAAESQKGHNDMPVQSVAGDTDRRQYTHSLTQAHTETHTCRSAGTGNWATETQNSPQVSPRRTREDRELQGAPHLPVTKALTTPPWQRRPGMGTAGAAAAVGPAVPVKAPTTVTVSL